MDSKELKRRFTYHPPIGDQPAKYEKLRRRAKLLASLILKLCPPDGDERDIAIRRLEEAVFYANAAIARRTPPTQ